MSERTERAKTVVMQVPTAEIVVAQAQSVITFMQIGYAVWIAIYLALGILSVGLPGIAAMAVYDSRINQALAGAGALAAAIFGFLKPHEYATGFDNAAQIAWQARNDFQLGKIDNIEVAQRLGHALVLTSFRYGTIVGETQSRGHSHDAEDGQRGRRWSHRRRRTRS